MTPPHINPSLLPLPKVNIVGELKIVLDRDEIEAMIDRYDEVHKGSRKFVSDKELFEFYEFEPSDAYYVRRYVHCITVSLENARAVNQRPFVNLINSVCSTGDNVQFSGKQFMTVRYEDHPSVSG